MSDFGYIYDPANCRVVWKCEGFPDAAAINSLISSLPEDEREGHVATTNVYGAMESPIKPLALAYCQRFADADEVFVIHDCDQPGQDGATWVTDPTGKKRPGWGPTLAAFCPVVKNVVLPYPIAKDHGPDARDWIREQRKELVPDQEIYRNLLKMARQGEVMPAAAVEVNRAAKRKGAAPLLESSRPVSVEQRIDSLSIPAPDDIWESEDDHVRLARLNLSVYQEFAGGRLLHWRDDFWKWRDGAWRIISDSDLSAKLHKVIRAEFERCWRVAEAERLTKQEESGREIKPKPVRQVTSRLIRDVTLALRSLVGISANIEMPSWLPDRTGRNFVSMRNGLLNLDAVLSGDLAGSLLPHTHEWFSSLKLGYDFDPNAQCLYWQEWLWDAFEGDVEAIDALQEWFGYLLTQDTSMQRFLTIVGKSRSGKGTIMRLVKALLGHSSICSPTPTTLSGQFGLASLIGKTLAVIPDARIGEKIDYTVLTERILSIVGEDPQEVERKYRPSLSGITLPIRFMLFSNEIPLFKDASDAILNRIIILVMNRSHAGQEDPRVEQRIHSELSGILNWAILGRHRLYTEKMGKIVQPKSGTDSVDWMRIEVSPVSAFVRECCLEGGACNSTHIFEVYQNWLKSNDLIDRTTRQAFGKRLRAIFPKIAVNRVHDRGYHFRQWTGISLKPEIEAQLRSF